MNKPTCWPLCFLALALTGCDKSAGQATNDTGAREATRRFYDAIIQQDWPNASSLLAAENAKAWTATEFNQRATTYRKQFGFEPARVQIRSCEEHGEEAIAHVDLSGPGRTRHHFKDTLVLHRQNGEWRVVLPPRFGKK